MNVTSNVTANGPGGAGASGPSSLTNTANELNGLPFETSLETVSRAQLSPEAQIASFQAPSSATPGSIDALTRFMGPLMTVANPVWGSDPVPRLRRLQKRLIEHSLTLDESDRSECMASIMGVETAVKLRLRYEQMRMSMADMDIKPEGVKAA